MLHLVDLTSDVGALGNRRAAGGAGGESGLQASTCRAQHGCRHSGDPHHDVSTAGTHALRCCSGLRLISLFKHCSTHGFGQVPGAFYVSLRSRSWCYMVHDCCRRCCRQTAGDGGGSERSAPYVPHLHDALRNRCHTTTTCELTFRLREMEEFRDVTCIAIACPACMTLRLAQSCSGYVTTVINNTDMVRH